MNKKQIMKLIDKTRSEEEKEKFVKTYNLLTNTKVELIEWQPTDIDWVTASILVCSYCYWRWFISNWKTKRRCVCNSL